MKSSHFITVLFSACGLLLFHPSFSQQITTPRNASPAASVSQTIGISEITVHYSRPSVKDRKIWGDLVPFGWNAEPFGNGAKAPWRAGANENTTITFSHEATVEGINVPAGTYGLFFAVYENNTAELVLSRDNRSWGNYFYDASRDQMRAKITMTDASHTELLTYSFTDITPLSATLSLNWEKKQFPVKISFNVPEIVLNNASEELQGAKGFQWEAHVSAANYALQHNMRLNDALQWTERAITQNRNFTTLNTKARVLSKLGRTEESGVISKEAFDMAAEAELNAYGYQLLNQGEHEKAIEIFTLNTKKYPKSANCFDSLGEAYATTGDTQQAIANFKKALSLHPEPNVKANSEKFLKQLQGK